MIHDTLQTNSQPPFRRLRRDLNLTLMAHLTSNVEKNTRVLSQIFSAKISGSVSLTFFLSALDRLVLSFSRAETCFTLWVKEEKDRLKKKENKRPKVRKDNSSLHPHHCGMREEFKFRSEEESESRNVTSWLAAIFVACNHECYSTRRNNRRPKKELTTEKSGCGRREWGSGLFLSVC